MFFVSSFLEKLGIVQTYLKSIFECYLTYISVGLHIPFNCPQEQNGTDKIWGTIVGRGTVCTIGMGKYYPGTKEKFSRTRSNIIDQGYHMGVRGTKGDNITCNMDVPSL